MSEIDSLRAENASLKVNIRSLAARIRSLEKWQDTVQTPWWKRLWFVVQGYRLTRLGRWYRMPWNTDAAQWDR